MCSHEAHDLQKLCFLECVIFHSISIWKHNWRIVRVATDLWHTNKHWMWCFISQEKQTHTWKNNVHHLWRLSVPLHDCLSKKKGLLCISIFHLPLYFLLCFFGTRQVSKTQYKYTIPSNFIQVNLSAYTSITWQWFVSRFFNTIK